MIKCSCFSNGIFHDAGIAGVHRINAFSFHGGNRGNTCRTRLAEMESERVAVEGHRCEHTAPRSIDCVPGFNLRSAGVFLPVTRV